MQLSGYHSSVLFAIFFFVLGFCLNEWYVWCEDPNNSDCKIDDVKYLKISSAISFSLSALVVLVSIYFNMSEGGGMSFRQKRRKPPSYDYDY